MTVLHNIDWHLQRSSNTKDAMPYKNHAVCGNTGSVTIRCFPYVKRQIWAKRLASICGMLFAVLEKPANLAKARLVRVIFGTFPLSNDLK